MTVNCSRWRGTMPDRRVSCASFCQPDSIHLSLIESKWWDQIKEFECCVWLSLAWGMLVCWCFCKASERVYAKNPLRLLEIFGKKVLKPEPAGVFSSRMIVRASRSCRRCCRLRRFAFAFSLISKEFVGQQCNSSVWCWLDVATSGMKCPCFSCLRSLL